MFSEITFTSSALLKQIHPILIQALVEWSSGLPTVEDSPEILSPLGLLLWRAKSSGVGIQDQES
jgi:hypothetical protein